MSRCTIDISAPAAANGFLSLLTVETVENEISDSIFIDWRRLYPIEEMLALRASTGKNASCRPRVRTSPHEKRPGDARKVCDKALWDL
mmetsp:Transcript_104930/g.208575  ORF Transcript_104930/g.208575 Transcript_104930/m.208575 type:complete len:88 (-) Transcript_104930:153-416(-)